MEGTGPKILVFSTETISDPGIDLAGRNKMHYSTSTYVITIPCSSFIKPQWMLHALKKGFSGIFIAADGIDCAFVPECTAYTGRVVAEGQKLLKENGYNASRIKMSAICSVCAESFVSYIEKFSEALIKIEAAEKGEK